jgi:hypothetical protein
MTEGKVLPYLDIPFQHASPDVLKQMRRPASQDKTLGRIKKWREECPDLTLRSTFIVGFPARPIAISSICSTGWMKRRSIVSAASSTSPSQARPRTASRTRAGRDQDRALECADGAAAEDFGSTPQAQGRHPPADHHR